ncbi:transposase [Bacillus sp. DX4.1]|uniref:transposase n=1 Tax=Bacillus sp. DX4.1 TaxID=3055867 RepID=UPI0025A00DC6|nr:transposase [Bacillus sp. DX4.1]MDM5187994.1 transposase [Bacillus sp. DX4.1]
MIPPPMMRKEETRSYKKDIRNASNWEYKENDDYYICPNNRKVAFKTYSKRTDSYGHTRDFKIYECEDCSGCPFQEKCTKAKGNRKVHYNPVYEELKAKAKRSLWSDEGSQIYAKRKAEVKSAFGHIKGNRSFRRFSLRGLVEVTIEFGLVAIAHNFPKQAEKKHLFEGKTFKTTKPTEKIYFLRGF